ncbi:MAG: 3-deoxy-manno-octulosonate cytidylyltransferase [Syntrophus sp. (in: bacteria)]|nr:3-deoxy-manno-octulosonate cytidylyltransferase [Syntrophus sp. (in: bacteria)]
MKRLIVIPARYASTRLPGKPLREIRGKSLIQLVYEKAADPGLKARVIIATDDERIEKAARVFGAEVVMTSPECRSGTDRVHEAISGLEGDYIVNLQGDEPFIHPAMIDALFTAMEKEHLDMATLCTPIKDEREFNNPDTVKVVMDCTGFALYFSRSPIPFLRGRQDVPLYAHVGIYAFSRSFLARFVALEKSALEEAESLEQLRVLENGFRIKVIPVAYDGFGIDTEEDLKRAKTILGKTEGFNPDFPLG